MRKRREVIERVCATCGRRRKVERHHPAGRENAPDVTVVVCSGCHISATFKQRESGILRGRTMVRDDGIRSVLVGLGDLATVAWQRLPDESRPQFPIALASRATSVAFDSLDPADWRPNPTADLLRGSFELEPVTAAQRDPVGQWQAAIDALHAASCHLFGPDDDWSQRLRLKVTDLPELLGGIAESSFRSHAVQLEESFTRLLTNPSDPLNIDQAQYWTGVVEQLISRIGEIFNESA